MKWLEEAAVAGYVRAQYSFALCLQQGRGVECNLPRAASDQSHWTVQHKILVSPNIPAPKKLKDIYNMIKTAAFKANKTTASLK